MMLACQLHRIKKTINVDKQCKSKAHKKQNKSRTNRNDVWRDRKKKQKRQHVERAINRLVQQTVCETQKVPSRPVIGRLVLWRSELAEGSCQLMA